MSKIYLSNFLYSIGEKLSANVPAAEEYQEEFKKIIATKGLSKKQVFNMDESGLYLKQLPNRTSAPKKFNNVSGPKKQLERITIAGCCNVDGSLKIPLLVIGKSKKP